MKNNLKIFEHEEFGKVRVVAYNGEPYFVGKDVADVLEYQNGSRDINRHVDAEDRRKMMVFDGNQNKETIVINESGLYDLILSSKLPAAKKFKRWVTADVLPTIRKTGGYVSNEEMFVATYFPFADEETKAMFVHTLQTVRKQNEVIEQQRKEITHKEDVIIGLVDDIDLATKRQRITQIVRHGAKSNYQDRYNLLYSEFERKYHCNLKIRMQSCTLKPKAKNKMDYIDREMKMIPQLYEIACKLFENDVELLKTEWECLTA